MNAACRLVALPGGRVLIIAGGYAPRRSLMLLRGEREALEAVASVFGLPASGGWLMPRLAGRTGEALLDAFESLRADMLQWLALATDDREAA